MARVYRCVPNGVFEGLAQEAVSDCTASLLRAASESRRQRLRLAPARWQVHLVPKLAERSPQAT